MAFHRSSLLLRKAIGSTRTAAVYSSYSSLLYDSSNSFDCRRWYSSSESDKGTTASAAGYHVNNGPAYMRGAVFWEKNKPLTFEDFHMPRPKANEILVKTKACGVCHSDLHVMKGELPFASPCVVGHEITGEVVEHGPLTDSKIVESCWGIYNALRKLFLLLQGKYVKKCLLNGQDDLCESFFAYNRAKGTLYDGETRLFLRSSGKPVYMYSMGGLAEFCVVPAHGLAILPNSLPYAESAILGCAVFTAYGAMAHAAQVRPGDAIAVIGIGVLAQGAHPKPSRIARAFGASEIIAVDVQDEKLQKAKIFGATHAINARKEDAVVKIKKRDRLKPRNFPQRSGSRGRIIFHMLKLFRCDTRAGKEGSLNNQWVIILGRKICFSNPLNVNFEQDITGGRGVDIAVEALGRPLTFSQCVQSVRDGGKAVMIGLTLSGAKGEVDINHLVRRQIKVIGSYGGRARQDLPKLIKLAERGIFNLEAAVSRKCKFEEAGEAYKDLDQGSIVGRAVVEIM
ncbi:hypothetical protein DH2020_015763 [Rehmannia glutinosa]|uniref:Enoyl reductase (ER) domain-containing protein n=1 Tax=Rehmannia glutinosa TaxID=99300 RepID=A0ABR0WU44_REHGL